MASPGEKTGAENMSAANDEAGDFSKPARGAEEETAKPFAFSSKLNLEEIRQQHAQFCKERDWGQYHSPRNLLLALVGEVGELAELFQWRGEVSPGLPGWTDSERVHLGQEISDVLIYLVRLAEKCEVDLPTCVLDKIKLNAVKYPADKVRGDSRKYTEHELTPNSQ